MYIVTSVTGNHQDDLDATLNFFFQVTFAMLSMLCINILPEKFASFSCYIVTSFNGNLGDAFDATV